MNIGDWVKKYRKEHGLSMQAFGNMCGLSRAYISILEKGINPTTNKPFSPTYQTLKKIADVTNIPIQELLDSLDKTQSVIVNSTDTPHLQSSKLSSTLQRYSEILKEAPEIEDVVESYAALDKEDRGVIRGEIKGMLRADKYSYSSRIKEDTAT